ncbi:hypothetical protein SDC9_07729 [bioreactor metagenome]|uniref:SIMPL domain-containing protein n=1 Tax=bioreactor metagenome TaxID=1076179 RepID=A0A644T5C8_9ZZZZ|nr:SIMPL domain-containing protein [Candidatus Elulimicrobiales bacterium]
MSQDTKNTFNSERVKKIISTPYFIFGVLLLLGFIILGSFFKSSLNNISVLTNAQGITVSGTAERYVTSDKGSLSIVFRTDSLYVSDTQAIKNLSDIRDNITKYLINYGISSENIDILSFYTSSQCSLRDKDSWDNCLGKRYNDYNQTIKVSSDDVDQIKDLSLNLNSALNSEFGSTLNSANISVQNTQYFYTEFDNVKSEMLNEATKNAFERAEAIAKSTGNSAGAVITASQGVFQVTAKDSVDTSDYGYYDTSTIDKKITAVVRVSFKVK